MLTTSLGGVYYFAQYVHFLRIQILRSYSSYIYIYSLEQVPGPQTSRWRFMHTTTVKQKQQSVEFSPHPISFHSDSLFFSSAKQPGNTSSATLPIRYPPNYRLSILVRRVASPILKHSELGPIRGDTPMPPSPFLPPRMGFGKGEVLQVCHPADKDGAAARNADGPEKE